MIPRLRLVLVALLFAWSALAAVHAPAAQPPCGVPATGIDDWRIETQAAAGIDPKPLCALIDKLDKLKPNVHGVVVVCHGALVFEHYWRGVDQKWGSNLGEVAHGPDVKHDIRSGSKSVVSLLVGIALDRKLIAGIEQPVFAFFPERAPLRSPAKDRITLRHLLTMSSGIAWDESIPYTSPRNSESLMISATDPYRYVLEQPLADEPGKRWNYSGGSTALLGAVVQRASKQWLPDFAREALFTPLGITDFEWVKMWNGEFAAASGLRLRPRDMAKIGQLALAHGEWKGKTIVSAEWIRQSTVGRFAAKGVYYGYQWWTAAPPNAAAEPEWFEAHGLGGQRIFVMPRLDLVVVITTGLYGAPNALAVTNDILDNFIVPAVNGR